MDSLGTKNLKGLHQSGTLKRFDLDLKQGRLELTKIV
jgi:hypothetical protein